MTLDKYLIQSSKIEEQEELISKFRTTDYISYEQKIAACNSIVNRTCYKTIDGKKIFNMNTPARQMMVIMNLIDLYTVVDVDFDNPLVFFNKIMETRAVDKLLSIVPEDEMTMFESLINMMLDDLINNTRSIASVLETKIDVISTALDTIINTFDNLQKHNANDIIEVRNED